MMLIISVSIHVAASSRAALVGLLVALPITFFFYDQNFSSLLCQQDRMRLRKGRYFHSSFLLVALFNVVGPLFGLPFVTGSLPHSPQMVRALSVDTCDADDGDRVVAASSTAVLRVYENRLA